MKSKIKSLNRNEQRTIIVFKMDKQIIQNIEKTFQKLRPNFKLSDYKKRYGNKILENFWELDKKSEDFNFTFVAKKDFIKLKLKGNLDFIKKFLKILEKNTEFSELLPKIKAKLQRKNFKFLWSNFV